MPQSSPPGSNGLKMVQMQRHQGPVIALVECPNIQLLKSGLRALEDFPCVTIPANLRDSQYQAIGWQVIAAKNGILRCAASSQWLDGRVSLSRYAHYNYGGIQARLTDNSTEEYSESSIESMLNNSQVDIVSSWTIAENLPKSSQDHFILIVSEFLYLPWKYALEESEKRASAVGNLCTPSITASTAEILESQMTEFLKIKIRSHFTERLLKIVSDANLHMNGRKKSRSDHNTLNGSLQSINSSYKGDSALDFIKYVCAVLALDQKVQHEVLIMRRNLLKLVNIREFAPEAEFHYLSLSLTLPNVICSHCDYCRDLDLCRDRTLTSEEWCYTAPQCGQPYDREVLENSPLQIIRQRERLYHLQDLVCLKCSHVKAAHLAEHCKCAGSFTCKEDSVEFHRKMQVFWDVAKDQKFQRLQECISWILEGR